MTRTDEESTSPGPRYRARTLRELLNDPEILTPPVAVIPYLAWPSRITIVVGREKSGKSTIVGQAVAALTQGGVFLSAPMASAKVLWLAIDEPVQDLVQRLTRFGADPDNVLVVDGEVTEEDLDKLCRDFGPTVVIVDCLANLAAGTVGEPGNAMEWGNVLLPLRALATRHSAAFVLIHHARKSGDEYRDSTAIGAQADMILTMKQAKDTDTRRDVHVKGRLNQRSFGVDFQEDRYILTDDRGSPTQTPTPDHRMQILDILDALAPERLSSAALERACELRGGSYARALRALKNLGWITSEKRGRSVVYGISASGKRAFSSDSAVQEEFPLDASHSDPLGLDGVDDVGAET